MTESNTKEMMQIDDTCLSVLQRYSRAIVHMRQQQSTQRFGLVFGAGASTDLGFPNWNDLITKIAAHREVGGTALLEASKGHTSQSQLLFQHYRAKCATAAKLADHEYNRLDVRIRADFQRIVHECLYEHVPSDISQLKAQDKYLWAFLDVLKATPLTVNYNFDDTLQRLLADARTAEERQNKRGFSTVWSSNIQLNSRRGVIYHPNGYLPHRLTERPSEHMVFLEDSFADQLIDSMAGHYTALANHLSQTTSLLVGLSLADSTLRHLLRQNAKAYPGHYHYYVAYVRDDAELDSSFVDAASAANFDVYNLITLFLKAPEVASLGKLLALNADDFAPKVEEVGRQNVQRYFLTGSVSVGKSTTTAHFRSLATHDEWTEERAPGMEKDPNLVEKEQISAIDNWVADQVAKKNVALRSSNSGIHVIDRAPLDAFAFTPAGEWQAKADFIRGKVSPGEAKGRKLVPGQVILLVGEPAVMAVRAIALHKVTDAEKLKGQQELLKRVYVGNQHKGVVVVDTRDKSVYQVVKEVARIIHLAPYEEADMDAWLTDLSSGVIVA